MVSLPEFINPSSIPKTMQESLHGLARPATKGGRPEIVDRYSNLSHLEDDLNYWHSIGEKAIKVKLSWREV